MTILKTTTTALRNGFADALSRVFYRQERLVIMRHGHPVAALVTMDDLEIVRQARAAADGPVFAERVEAAARQSNGAKGTPVGPLPKQGLRPVPA